jgi:hypothetical protein
MGEESLGGIGRESNRENRRKQKKMVKSHWGKKKDKVGENDVSQTRSQTLIQPM